MDNRSRPSKVAVLLLCLIGCAVLTRGQQVSSIKTTGAVAPGAATEAATVEDGEPASASTDVPAVKRVTPGAAANTAATNATSAAVATPVAPGAGPDVETEPAEDAAESTAADKPTATSVSGAAVPGRPRITNATAATTSAPGAIADDEDGVASAGPSKPAPGRPVTTLTPKIGARPPAAAMGAETEAPTEVSSSAPPLALRRMNCTDVPPGTRHTCAEQVKFGKCGEEYMVRFYHCSKSCGLPPCCFDDTPKGSNYTCKQYKDWGKCSEDWMVRDKLCSRTCGRVADGCPADPPSLNPMEAKAKSASASASKGASKNMRPGSKVMNGAAAGTASSMSGNTTTSGESVNTGMSLDTGSGAGNKTSSS